jgi:hypothetical protein
MALIKFVANYNDLSTDNGFQFEFCCDRCGSGYQTSFQASATSLVSGALSTAANIFGGILGGAAEVGDRVRSATWEKAHDEAFARAVEQAKPFFKQCRRCGHWVDDVCWNAERGLCLDCAPDFEIESSAAQAAAAVEAAEQTAREVKYVNKAKFEQTVVATCPQCGATASGGKFCAECGAPLAKEKHCTECGTKVKASAKFCPECGAKQG